jgi:hypothetical protein
VLHAVWIFCVSAYAAYEDWRRFKYGAGSHDLFAEVWAAFSVFYGENVGHSCFERCEA